MADGWPELESYEARRSPPWTTCTVSTLSRCWQLGDFLRTPSKAPYATSGQGRRIGRGQGIEQYRAQITSRYR
jgi:hypothetical protein